jgi:hypothetical protein
LAEAIAVNRYLKEVTIRQTDLQAKVAKALAGAAISTQNISKVKFNEEVFVRGPVMQLRNILEPVDLTDDGNDDEVQSAAKRQRTDTNQIKSNVAIMHEKG